jgi:AN1-type zinc finger protein 1
MDRDVEAIGAHCEFEYCHQLDFLPFRCDSCHHTYCLDHRTETAHKCTHAGEWAKNRRLQSTTASSNFSASTGKPTLTNATQCSSPTCKTFVNTSQNLGVHCQNCNRTYCLKHRMREDHDCKTLVPLGARPLDVAMQNNREKIKLGFGRLKTWGKERQEALTPKPKPTSKAAQLAALNTLKKNAKGDDKLPAEKRVYLHVEAEAASTTAKLPKADLFFSNDWSIGRLLDDAAKRLQVANVNNRVETEEQRLRVYFVEGGRLLEFSEKVGTALASGNTVVLLRGVGPKPQS